MTDHEWKNCEICRNIYCLQCTNNEENLPLTCIECYNQTQSHLRFHSHPLIQKVLYYNDPLCLSNFEDFELYYSRVFEHHPEILYHPVLQYLYDYLLYKFLY